ncbi:MAG: FAD/NAD(P)-binding oxidoreductase [Bdellovibrionales bacterium]|jgi:sulfide:quinone oxidoreductase|nr:FAD/NAD(P)-binding oxidoreductase [Bdellovibrionales bacterium]
MSKTAYKIVILGGGSGGVSLAARLKKHLASGEIAIVEPSNQHFYQPMWTLVGAGLADKESTARSQKDVMPAGVDWIQDRVALVQPEKNTVRLANGQEIAYEYLVVATGLQLDWGKIEGLEGHLGKNGICSIYQFDQVDAAARMINEFQGGTALFVMPPVPIKCAGAPQKIMYLAEHIFRNNGVREKSNIQFATAGAAMFGIPLFSEALAEIVEERGIEPKFKHRLVAVNASKKEATFEVTKDDGQVERQTLKFDLLHVVPTMSAHAYVAESGLAVESGDQKGWLAVDKHTLRHLKYGNIFGIGDVTGVPNSKTGAAIRSQAPIVAENILAVMGGSEPSGKYDGYSSCPLITEIGKVMLAEFGYDGKLLPTFPLNPAVSRRTMWVLKRHILPTLYWQGMLKGRA